MTRSHCQKCGALIIDRTKRVHCDPCTDRINEVNRAAFEADQERFDAMTHEEREIYYAAAEAAWRQEEYGRLDA
jgi:uncharacterized Zn finger protein (UPF0148 family)